MAWPGHNDTYGKWHGGGTGKCSHMVSQDTTEAMSELINRSFQCDGISLYSRLDVREDVTGCEVGLLAGVLQA